jgi:hypothetical protein
MTTLGLEGATVEPVAMRGERLAVVRVALTARDFEVVALLLVETGDEGRGLRTILYDLDDLEDALDELDERFLAGEGAAHASWLRQALIGIRRAQSQRDWDALRQIYANDVVLDDHRPAGAGEQRGVEFVLDYDRAMVELAPTYRLVVRRHLAIGDHIALAELVSGSDDTEGDVGRYEVASLIISVHGPEGRITRTERFAIDDLDAAWTRYRELGGQT